MYDLTYILMSVIFAFFDPFILVPSFLIGWFVSDRNGAVLISGTVSIIIGFIVYKTRLDIGDGTISLLPFLLRFVSSLLIAYLANILKSRRNEKKLQKKT